MLACYEIFHLTQKHSQKRYYNGLKNRDNIYCKILFSFLSSSFFFPNSPACVCVCRKRSGALGSIPDLLLTYCVTLENLFYLSISQFGASLVTWTVKNTPAMQENPGLISGSGRSPGDGVGYLLMYSWASLETQTVKNLPAMQETWVPSLGWEDPLEEGMASHSSILAWRMPMDRGAWQAAVHGITKSRTWLSD